MFACVALGKSAVGSRTWDSNGPAVLHRASHLVAACRFCISDFRKKHKPLAKLIDDFSSKLLEPCCQASALVSSCG